MDLSAFLTGGELSPSQPRVTRWRPDLSGEDAGAPHSEIFAAGNDASGAALALALALQGIRAAGQEERSLLWVQDRASQRLNGRPCRAGLPPELRRRVIHVAARKPEDALFALEEGVRCRDLACVIGEIAGNPQALDFTASRRLTLAAERHGVPLFLVRHDAQADLSSASLRGATFDEAILERALFRGADLSRASARKVDARTSDWTEAASGRGAGCFSAAPST